jgi:hypothetical protein
MMSFGWKPLPKSEQIELFLSDVILGYSDSFKDIGSKLKAQNVRRITIEMGACVVCNRDGIKPSSFRNINGVREFMISGLCQICQDDVYGTDD